MSLSPRRIGSVFAAAVVVLTVQPSAGGAAIGSIKEFVLPSGRAEELAPGPDGNVWFTAFTTTGSVGRIMPDGSIVAIAEMNGDSQPRGITTGPDGRLWFTDSNLPHDVGAIAPTGGSFTFYPTKPTPEFITAGPDGRLWFTTSRGTRIFQITTSGALSSYPLPPGDTATGRLIAGADGAVWFVDWANNAIGRITTAGQVTEFAVPTPSSGPWGITAGPRGNVWFTEWYGNNIGRITPRGRIREFPLPPGSDTPEEITTGPDGYLWFTDLYDNVGNSAVARMSRDGTTTTYPLRPHRCSAAIAPGADGNLWFTQSRSCGPYIDRLHAAFPQTSYVFGLASGFAPQNRTTPLGHIVRWCFYGPNAATATDTSGMGMYDSGPHPPVSFFLQRFLFAGTFPYEDTFHTAHTGSISVPVRVPTTATVGTAFTVQWATANPATNQTFDAQFMLPGTTTWTSLAQGVTTLSTPYTPAAAGTYEFRARLRSSPGRSGWSPPASVVVT